MPPTFRSGKNAYLTITSATGGVINYSSGVDSASLERSVNAPDVTTFGDSDHNRLPGGLRDFTLSFSGHFASTYEEKLSAALGHTTTLSWVFGPESTSNTRRKLSGSGVLTGFTIGAEVDDKVSMSGTLAGSGSVTSTTF